MNAIQHRTSNRDSTNVTVGDMVLNKTNSRATPLPTQLNLPTHSWRSGHLRHLQRFFGCSHITSRAITWFYLSARAPRVSLRIQTYPDLSGVSPAWKNECCSSVSGRIIALWRSQKGSRRPRSGTREKPRIWQTPGDHG